MGKAGFTLTTAVIHFVVAKPGVAHLRTALLSNRKFGPNCDFKVCKKDYSSFLPN